MNYRHFNLDEFKCSETGENEIDPEFVAQLDRLRQYCAFPFVITSGYRSPEHSIEKAKDKPGMHTTGKAADIQVKNGVHRMKLVRGALMYGFTGIGVAEGFVHVDQRESVPVMWTY